MTWSEADETLAEADCDDGPQVELDAEGASVDADAAVDHETVDETNPAWKAAAAALLLLGAVPLVTRLTRSSR